MIRDVIYARRNIKKEVKAVIKMIVVDLDGTLLNSERKVSNLTKNYLRKLKDKGYIITIATGRIYASVLKATDGAEFASYIISDTGSCVYDRDKSSVVFSNYIDSEMVSKLFDYYSDDCCYIDVCDKNTIYKYSDEVENSNIVKTIKDKDYIIENCKDISHMSISMKSNESVINLYNSLVKEFKELEVMIMQDSFSERKWIEIVPKGISKYNRIRDLANYLNINNDEIMAFGDGLNDIDMLKNCGYSVALSNALPEVVEVAGDVTTFDNNNDGVINYLKGYLCDEREV